jgi:hypothetical protein
MRTAIDRRDDVRGDRCRLTREHRGAIVDRVAAPYLVQGCLDFLGRALA